MNLREDLLAHERAASAVYEQEKGIKPANNRFGYYTYLRTAADLADYVSKAFTTKNSKEREVFYISKGFRSYDAILNEHRDEISHSKKTSIRDIKPGDRVTAYDICVISNTYDLMHGMTVNKEDPIHPFVCLRSEIGGVYSDNITEDDRFYNYSLEKETQANFESASFSKPVNRLLYDDFLRQDILSQAMQIPAHLFVRYSNHSDYVYRGVYFVNSLIDGNKMFELIRESFVINPLGVMSGDKQMLEEFKKDRRAFFQKLYSKSADTFAHDHRLREVRDLPPEFFDVLPDGFHPISGDNLEQVLRDYLEEAAIRQQIGSLGEELVREY